MFVSLNIAKDSDFLLVRHIFYYSWTKDRWLSHRLYAVTVCRNDNLYYMFMFVFLVLQNILLCRIDNSSQLCTINTDTLDVENMCEMDGT